MWWFIKLNYPLGWVPPSCLSTRSIRQNMMGTSTNKMQLHLLRKHVHKQTNKRDHYMRKKKKKKGGAVQAQEETGSQVQKALPMAQILQIERLSTFHARETLNPLLN